MRTISPREIEYPESDGKPMAETDDHRDWMVCLIDRLKQRYSGKRVYVSGNLFIYYVEGDATKVVAPDVFVALKCSPRKRRIFKVWEEGKGPDFVLETTSRKTRAEDKGKKKTIFSQLGVSEYFLYDPLAEWLKPPLQGFRLLEGQYESIAPAADGSIVSKVLGTRLVLEAGELAMYDVRTCEKVLGRAELTDKALSDKATAELQVAELERRLAEVEVARKQLEEENARLRKQHRTGGNGARKNGN